MCTPIFFKSLWSKAMNWTGNQKLLVGILLVIASTYAVASAGFFGDKGVGAIEGVAVRRGDLRISELARGNLESKNAAQLVNELEGRANIIYLIEEGTRVAVGDVICELDTSSHQDRLVDQAISVDRAQAASTKATEQYGIQVIQNASDEAEAVLALDLAELSLESYAATEGEWEVELATAEEAIVLAEERIKQAEDTLQWTRKLYDQGFVQKTELDGDELAVTSQRITRDQAVRNRNLKKNFGDKAKRKELSAAVESRRRDLEVVRKQAAAKLVDFDSERSSTKRELERQREKYDKLVDQVSKGILLAPEDGLVVYARSRGRHGTNEVPTEGGEVHERQAIVTIPRAGGMVADVSLHETKLDKVQVGLTCLVSVDALPGELFQGRISSVAAVADSGSWMSNPNQRLYRTEVALEDEVPEMRPGMSCSIEILVEDLADVLYIPRQSVFLDAGEPICFVNTKKGLDKRKVTVGQDNNKFVHVLSGLQEGEIVALSPPTSWEPEPAPETAASRVAATKPTEPPVTPAAPGPPANAGGPSGGEGAGSFSPEQAAAMRKRFEGMSEEERAQAIQRMREGAAGGRRGSRASGDEE